MTRNSLILALLALGVAVSGNAATPTALPDQVAKAWTLVENAQAKLLPKFRGDEPTDRELQAFAKQLQAAAVPAADIARAFLAKFPKDEHAIPARALAIEALQMAVLSGDAAREAELDKFLSATAADTTLTDDVRVHALLTQFGFAVLKGGGLRAFVGVDDPDRDAARQKAERKALLTAKRLMPDSATVYTQLLALARRSAGDEARSLAAEIAGSDGAPAYVKTAALDLIDGRKPFEIGKPLDIRFTALDGRAVDFAKLKGKVVLVDFWATWCGPCVGEVPHVKAAYEKFHDKGFEIVGISLDEEKPALVAFIEKKKLAWPQYWTGKGWEDPMAVRFGVDGIPEMWLVDRQGNLRDTDAREDLVHKVTKLLEEKP